MIPLDRRLFYAIVGGFGLFFLLFAFQINPFFPILGYMLTTLNALIAPAILLMAWMLWRIAKALEERNRWDRENRSS